jgi:ATP-binding protein involved in chromosome partitioning
LELAYRLAARGHRVGIFDADVHGPSLPSQLPPSVGAERVQLGPGGWSVEPLRHGGVTLMSFGWLSRLWGPFGGDDGKEVRTGSLPGEVMSQLLQQTRWAAWGDLDFLVIDSPPGTGEVQKALYSKMPLAGAVVVTTPSPLATADVVRGVKMLQR